MWGAKKFFCSKIFDAKNGLFPAASVKNQVNPLSSCGFYGCNGVGSLIDGKTKHKSCENCSNFKVDILFYFSNACLQ